ncbi:NADH-quinone oxidoreductase subunit A, partial [Anaplasma platys]
LFPWSVSLAEICATGYWSMLAFLAVLTVGFIYEWNSGALEWE